MVYQYFESLQQWIERWYEAKYIEEKIGLAHALGYVPYPEDTCLIHDDHIRRVDTCIECTESGVVALQPGPVRIKPFLENDGTRPLALQYLLHMGLNDELDKYIAK